MVADEATAAEPSGVPEGLAPRIQADIHIDGEIRPITLRRHIGRSNIVLALVALFALIQIERIVSMALEGSSAPAILGQVGISLGVLFMGHHQWSQRQLLKGMLASRDP